MPLSTASAINSDDAAAPVEARRLCADHNLSFERLFRYQYVISAVDLDLPGFFTHRAGGFVLQTGPDLECQILRDSNGKECGFVFGLAIQHDGQSLSEAFAQDIDGSCSNAQEDFEDLITKTVGRFGIMIVLQESVYFYQDVSGTIGAVCNSDIKCIAASPNLCLDRSITPSTLFVTDDANARHCQCGLHFTEDESVVRINPSFRFDLKKWRKERFWPREGDLFEHDYKDYALHLDEIISAVRAVCRRMTSVHDVTLSLSGGYDSRAIYAIADNETRERFAQIFSAVHNKIGWYDAMVASAVCGLDGLGIEIHQTARPRRLRTKAELAQAKLAYYVGTGKRGHVPIETQLGSYSKIIDNAIVMRGQQIPILKAIFVKNTNPDAWTEEFLVDRVITMLGAAEAPEETKKAIAESTRALVATYPQNARARIVDLLLMEAVNGPELAEMFTGFSHAFYLSPFNSRRLVQLLAGFLTSHRADLSTFHHLLFRADPRVCGLATTGQVKTVQGKEGDEAIARRFGQIRGYGRTYHERIGEQAPSVQIRRFTTFGASLPENQRRLRQLFLEIRRRDK